MRSTLTAALVTLTLTALGAGSAAAHPGESHAPAAPGASAQRPMDASSPTAAVASFEAALDAGDSAAAIALLSEDVTIFEQGHVERSRAEYIEHHLPSDIEFSRAVPSRIISRKESISGDMAVVSSETASKGEFKGKPVDTLGVGTIVLRRTPQGWRIVHIHWSSRKAPA